MVTNWKAGEFPPVGTVCEAYAVMTSDSHYKWIQVEILKILQAECVVYSEEKSKTLFCGKFRPIQTERQQVIANANIVIGDDCSSVTILNDLYDAGMLKAAKESS